MLSGRRQSPSREPIMPATRRSPHFAIALTVLTGASPIAHADVYKCAGDGGTPIYQEMPCPRGKELRNFQTDPPQLTILPAPAPAGPAPAKDAAARVPKNGKDARPAKAGAAAGDASERKHIRTGMPEAEVLARLGHPEMTAGGKNRSSVRWTYLPAPGDPDMITTLILTNGTVTDVQRKVVKK